MCTNGNICIAAYTLPVEVSTLGGEKLIPCGLLLLAQNSLYFSASRFLHIIHA